MAATILLLVYKQWGLGSPSINFPIAFPKECFIAAITRAAGNYEHSIVITTKNKTNLSWICKGYDNSAGNTYANWLALGCQLQWGYSNSTGVTFPIAFRECYAVVSNAHSNTTGNTDHYHLLSWTSTGAAFGYWNMSFYGTLYIALGVE